MSRSWRYEGRDVLVSPTADIPTEYRANKPYAHIVQQVLDQMPPWRQGDDPVVTLTDFATPMLEIVVSGSRDKILWAKHKGHHARQVEPSPFVTAEKSYTRSFTVEMTASSARPRLVRAYPGDYIPPLPWQKSAKYADGGRAACVTFWQQHAYVYHPALIVPGSTSRIPPRWFMDLL